MSTLMNDSNMMDKLRLKILENGLQAGIENIAEFYYSEIPGFTEKHFQILIHELDYHENKERWRIMDIIRFHKPNQLDEGFTFILTDKGFIEAENDLNGLHTSLIIKILQFLDELGRLKIITFDLKQMIRNKFTQIDSEKIIARMKWTLNLNYLLLLTNKDERSPISPFNCISDNGISILKAYYHSKDIFNTTLNKQELLKEHHMVYKLKQMGEYKDAIIKMGSIVEYVISEWLKRNSHPNPKKFENKLNKLEHLSKSSLTGSITPTEWRIVNSIIRDYRNFIHLQKYFDDRIVLNESDFLQLEPIYKKILHELS